MPGFKELLQRVAEYYRDHATEIRQQNAQLGKRSHSPAAAEGFGRCRTRCIAARARARPRSSNPSTRVSAASAAHPNFLIPEHRALPAAMHALARRRLRAYMATLTLTRMAEGGIYDQLGGGFARYSVDDALDDPALREDALRQRAAARRVRGSGRGNRREPCLRASPARPRTGLLRDMRAPEGGFYSSLDADSEGHEGKFYRWNRAEVRALLTRARICGVFAPLRARSGRQLRGRLASARARAHAERPERRRVARDRARAKLLAARTLRVWPARDEKILTAWNALMIKGLAIAARVLRPARSRRGRHCGGRFHPPHPVARRPSARDLQGRSCASAGLSRRLRLSRRCAARALADALARPRPRVRAGPGRSHAGTSRIRRSGGFFFTASDHERLIHRSKTFSDDSLQHSQDVLLCTFPNSWRFLIANAY